MCEPMVLVASEAELPTRAFVWGTGGWVPPEQREALDWLTFCRLCGWGVTVVRIAHPGEEVRLPDGCRWIVFSCSPEYLEGDQLASLESRLVDEPILAVVRAGSQGSPLARLAGSWRHTEGVSGRSLSWIGPGMKRTWRCRQVVAAAGLQTSPEAVVWAQLDGLPLVAVRAVGRGSIATLGFHPSHARDDDGSFSALLKQLLVWGALGPIAWIDFEGTMVLRMDDPGGAQNIYSRTWSYPKLDEAKWGAIGDDLSQRNARLSIGYVAGWADDGDAERGVLMVAGTEPRRFHGKVHPSPSVRYRDLSGHSPGRTDDYELEYRGIQALRRAKVAEVELHGHTHMHPDSEAWRCAPDRYETWPATHWYRELGEPARATIAALPAGQHPLELGVAAFQRFFGCRPTTLIPPGDQWTTEVLQQALDLGLQLVSSYYLALRNGDRFCWSTHVCAPYLNQPDSAWFAAGLPVIGYFHDYEPAVYGVRWLSEWLDSWSEAGARRFIDFRELAAAVCRRLRLDSPNGVLQLGVDGRQAPNLVRPLIINVRAPGSTLPSELAVKLDTQEISLSVEPLAGGCGRVIVPAAE